LSKQFKRCVLDIAADSIDQSKVASVKESREGDGLWSSDVALSGDKEGPNLFGRYSLGISAVNNASTGGV
jgi:hypothetical protein